MGVTRRQRAYWRKNLIVTASLLAVWFVVTFVVSFFALGYIGTQHPTPTLTMLGRTFSVLYFAFFILMPWYTKMDKTKPVPDRVTFTKH